MWFNELIAHPDASHAARWADHPSSSASLQPQTDSGSENRSSPGGPADAVAGIGSARASSALATEASPSKSALASFPFFKNLSGEKKTRDGQPPKRRGPKPDSKPALTRRQELNRQAQRTHRERKEMYIKALEQEVMRMKELFTNTAQERDKLAEEVRKLKEIIAAHGIPYDLNSPPAAYGRAGSASYGGSSSGSVSGSYGPGSNSTGYTSPPNMSQFAPPPPPPVPNASQMATQQQHVPQQQRNLDYDQIGIDFVLTYDKTPYLSPPPQLPPKQE